MILQVTSVMAVMGLELLMPLRMARMALACRMKLQLLMLRMAGMDGKMDLDGRMP